MHCVFHGIRFKVNKDWLSGIDSLLFLYTIHKNNTTTTNQISSNFSPNKFLILIQKNNFSYISGYVVQNRPTRDTLYNEFLLTVISIGLNWLRNIKVDFPRKQKVIMVKIYDTIMIVS